MTTSQVLKSLHSMQAGIYAAALIVAAQQGAVAGPGALDTAYLPNLNDDVYATGLQADGRLVIGGDFSTVGGVNRGRIARLWPNGALDTSFQNNMSGVTSGRINCLAVQSDGRIVIGGTFSSVNNSTRNGIARLLTNGALDGSFIPTNYSNVRALAVQSDNKVIIGGGTTSIGYVYRLNTDGSRENAFTNYSTGPNKEVLAVALQPDGKILIGGSFTHFNGTPRNYLARLDSDGWLDPSFLFGMTGPGGAVRCISVQPDGKILIAGDFSSVNNTPRNRVARLTSTGMVDPGFVPTNGLNNQVYAMCLQPDNRVVIGGSFTGGGSLNIARLNPDGTTDSSFARAINSFNPTYAVAVQDDGAVVAGGSFSAYSPYSYIARFYGDLYPPEFYLQPTNRSVVVGTNVTLTALVNNPTPTLFQWRKNGSDIFGATGMSYTLNNVQMTDAGTYSVSAFNSAGSATSTNAVLNVGITPGITMQPVSVLVPFGGATNISVTATGAPLTYVWIKNGAVLPGATSSVLSFPYFVNTNAGSYYVIVSNFLKVVQSATVTASMRPPLPSIVAQPQSQAVAAGMPATFSVIATNATSYIWRKDGLLVGPNSPTYTIPFVTTANAGNYTVVVSSAGGSVTSSVAVLTVISPPYFTLQPKSANTNIGASVTFSAAVGGTPPIGLQWRKDGVNIPYATLSTYTIANVQVGDTGVYSVYANNAAGGLTSSNAILNVGIRPIITAWSGSLTVTQGNSASFSVSATGTPLSYFWSKNGVRIAGATSTSYSIPSTVGTNSGNYSVIVSNALGIAATNALLTVLVPVSIVEEPTSRLVGEGSNTTFSVTALGTSPAYQWYKNSGLIAGATDSAYTLNSVQFSDAAGYSVVVSNILNSVTSQVASLTVTQYPPEIVMQPTNLSVAVSNNALFTVGTTGTTLTYQWFKDVTNLLAATTPELLLTNVGFADAGGYSVVVANPLGSATSVVATLTVGCAPEIVTQPTNQAVPVGSNAAFSIVASGTEPLSYQWRKEEADLPGQTGTALQLSAVTATNAGSYSVLVTSPFGAITSAVATLTVQFPPQITQDPVGGLQPAGSNFTFAVTATGTEPLSYQWQKNGEDLLGATATNYVATSLAAVDSGSYAVVVSNFLGSVTSSVAVLIVGYPPVVAVPPQSSTNLLCRTAVLSCTVTGTPPISLRWFFNGEALAGETNATLTLMNLGATNAGNYSVSAVSSFGATTSPTAQLSIYGTATPATWATTGSLANPGESHTAILLRNGLVLVAGGDNNSVAVANCELFDPASGNWTVVTNPMAGPRSRHTATLLANGTVLAVGGDTNSVPLASAEVFDPASATWASTSNSLTAARYYHTATLLTNGLVLVVGGVGPGVGYLASAELYDPATEMWTPAAPMAIARREHTATLLTDGRVLVAGGYGNAGDLSSVEVFDPVQGTWTTISPLPTARSWHTATLLVGGKVLVAGGMGSSGSISSTALFDPSNGTWTETSPMAYGSFAHTATLLPGGQVLIAGGYGISGYLSRAELFDPSTEAWTSADNSLSVARCFHTSTLLQNGQVLTAGGEGISGSLSSSEIYAAGLPTLPVTLGNLFQTRDGTAKPVSATTDPPGLAVDVTYDGSPNAPTNTGSYTVVGMINDPCYQGGATNTLVIHPPAPTLTVPSILSSGEFQFYFASDPGASFSVLVTTNAALPLSYWTVLGSATEVAPGQFQFTDLAATNFAQRFYRVQTQ